VSQRFDCFAISKPRGAVTGINLSQLSRLRQTRPTALLLMGQWAKVIQSRSITVGEPKS
jgi:hypothetical protein